MSSREELPYYSRRGRSAELLPAGSQRGLQRGRGGQVPDLTLPLLRPWASGVISLSLSFLLLKLEQRDDLVLPTGVKMKGSTRCEVPGTQLVSKIWAEKSLSSRRTQMPPLHCIASCGRVFLSSHCFVTLSNPFRDARPPNPPAQSLHYTGAADGGRGWCYMHMYVLLCDHHSTQVTCI